MSQLRSLALVALCSVGSFAITSCMSAPSMSHAEMKRPLYERLGGEAAIRAVVDDFVARAAADPKVNFTRKGTAMEWDASPGNVAHLKAMLVQMIGSATGGPQRYEGRGMKEAHAGMRITNAEFDALAGDLVATLVQFKVPAPEQHELLEIVGSTRGEIVSVR